MTIGNFLELLGTDSNDSITGSDLEIVYGIGDGDSLVAGAAEDSNTRSITVLVGGTGRNLYSIRENATAVIFENSGSSDNTLYTTILAPGIDRTAENFIIADIDGRHLYFGNPESNQYAFLVDWQIPENQIETFYLVDGITDYETFASSYQELPGYLGNLSWSEVTERGAIDIERLGLNADFDDEIETITARASELEPPGSNITNPLPEGQEVGNFRELVGTEESDIFGGFDREIVYGLGGNDSLETNYGSLASGKATSFLVGGTGNSSYSIAENSTAIIIENGNSDDDSLTVEEIAIDISNEENASVIAEIDERHLLIGDTDYNQYAILIDWQQSANRIETFNLVEGRVTYESFANNFRNSNGYRGNLTWSELETQGLIDLERLDLEPATIDDSLNTIVERSLSLEGIEDNNNEDDDNTSSDNNQIGNFLELLGTDNNDSLTGSDLEIVYGIEDGDSLVAGAAEDPDTRSITVLVGGTGRNLYSIRENATAVIFENSGSSDNTLYTTILAPGIDRTAENFVIADIDGRHLYFGNPESNQYAFLVDWQIPENRIENWYFVDGTISYDTFTDGYQELPGYLGNLSWSEVTERGTIDIERLGLNADFDDEIDTITARASELEGTGNSNIELFRFRNTTLETGTYVFVGETERDAIQANEDLSNFALDGVTAEGVNPAFTASLEPEDNLLPFYRLASVANPGTFLFVGTEEYRTIFAPSSDQRNQWEKQGLNTAGEDIPEFYLYGVGAERGVEFHRFQNRENGTFLFAAPEETAAINSDADLSNVFIDQGVAFEAL